MDRIGRNGCWKKIGRSDPYKSGSFLPIPSYRSLFKDNFTHLLPTVVFTGPIHSSIIYIDLVLPILYRIFSTDTFPMVVFWQSDPSQASFIYPSPFIRIIFTDTFPTVGFYRSGPSSGSFLPSLATFLPIPFKGLFLPIVFQPSFTTDPIPHKHRLYRFLCTEVFPTVVSTDSILHRDRFYRLLCTVPISCLGRFLCWSDFVRFDFDFFFSTFMSVFDREAEDISRTLLGISPEA